MFFFQILLIPLIHFWNSPYFWDQWEVHSDAPAIIYDLWTLDFANACLFPVQIAVRD
jgi:hypothetical protein